MTIANKIKERLDQFEPGEVFTIMDFGVGTKDQPTLVRYLNRKVAQNRLSRFSKGRYYKPRNSMFGQLSPTPYQAIKDLLVKGGKTIGYISGVPVFARFGLTTQISSEILIGSSIYRRPTERAKYKISFFIQRNEITESNIPMLQLLDAIKFFREIPATAPNEVIRIIIAILSEKNEAELQQFAELALTYPNYVRALLGAMLEVMGKNPEKLRKSLNGVTSYRLNVSEKILPTKSNWNIA